jgi:hypothetical protein
VDANDSSITLMRRGTFDSCVNGNSIILFCLVFCAYSKMMNDAKHGKCNIYELFFSFLVGLHRISMLIFEKESELM